MLRITPYPKKENKHGRKNSSEQERRGMTQRTPRPLAASLLNLLQTLRRKGSSTLFVVSSFSSFLGLVALFTIPKGPGIFLVHQQTNEHPFCNVHDSKFVASVFDLLPLIFLSFFLSFQCQHAQNSYDFFFFFFFLLH